MLWIMLTMAPVNGNPLQESQTGYGATRERTI